MTVRQNRKIRHIAILFCIAASGLFGLLHAAQVQFIKDGDRWVLHKDGQPYFIKGVGGGGRMEKTVAWGANSVRAWYQSQSTLDNAEKHGLTVLMGIPTTVDSARQTVQKYKNHPALLIWAIGNEEEHKTSDRIALWQRMQSVAQMVHQEDGNHPVITVLADIYNNKLQELMQYAPALDAVGINTYGNIMSLSRRLAETGWTKPYLVTEFGPQGHWEAPKESWGVPIEMTTTQKATHYLAGYRLAIDNQPLCVGSYVFLWGQKQEKTHTWYGMFLPDSLGGNPLNPVDAMYRAWNGTEPANRCPDIGPGTIRSGLQDNMGTGTQRFFGPGSRIRVELDASDADGDPLRYGWDLRFDVTDNTGTGGAYEPPTTPIAGAVISTSGTSAVIQLPLAEDYYRIHAYVYDNQGNASTANIGVVVGAQYAITAPGTSRPQIRSFPAVLHLNEGADTAVTVESTGYPLNYRWIITGTPVTGRSTSRMPLSSVQKADSGTVVQVIVYNDLGADTAECILSIGGFTGPQAIRIAQPPRIDGVVDQIWQSVIATATRHTIVGNVTNAADCSATFRCIWDDTCLYALVEVRDDMLRANSTPLYNNDGIEIYIDSDNSKDTTYGSTDFQFRLAYNNTTIDERNGRSGGAVAGLTSTTSGYVIELALPWTLLACNPKTGQLVGFDLQVNDNDNTARDGKISWNAQKDNAWHNPSLFGTIRLAGTAQSSVVDRMHRHAATCLISRPVLGTTTLRFTSPGAARQALHVSLLDLKGALCASWNVCADNATERICLPLQRPAANGIYIVRVTSQGWPQESATTLVKKTGALQ